MTNPEQQRVAVVVYLTAEDEKAAAALVGAALQGRATIDGRRLDAVLRGYKLTAEVARVEPLSYIFDSGWMRLTPGREPYLYQKAEEKRPTGDA